MVTFTNEGTTQGLGDMVTQRFYTVDRKKLGELLDVDRLAGSARAMVENEDDPDGVAAHFLEGLESQH